MVANYTDKKIHLAEDYEIKATLLGLLYSLNILPVEKKTIEYSIDKRKLDNIVNTACTELKDKKEVLVSNPYFDIELSLIESAVVVKSDNVTLMLEFMASDYSREKVGGKWIKRNVPSYMLVVSYTDKKDAVSATTVLAIKGDGSGNIDGHLYSNGFGNICQVIRRIVPLIHTPMSTIMTVYDYAIRIIDYIQDNISKEYIYELALRVIK